MLSFSLRYIKNKAALCLLILVRGLPDAIMEPTLGIPAPRAREIAQMAQKLRKALTNVAASLWGSGMGWGPQNY